MRTKPSWVALWVRRASCRHTTQHAMSNFIILYYIFIFFHYFILYYFYFILLDRSGQSVL